MFLCHSLHFSIAMPSAKGLSLSFPSFFRQMHFPFFNTGVFFDLKIFPPPALQVEELIDTPHMRREVARKRHRSAECGSVAEVAKQRSHA